MFRIFLLLSVLGGRTVLGALGILVETEVASSGKHFEADQADGGGIYDPNGATADGGGIYDPNG